MEKVKMMKLMLCHYLIVLCGVLFFRQGATIDYPCFVILQIIFTVVNHKSAKKLSELLILSLNLLISTVLANILMIFLYTQLISADAESYIIGMGGVLYGSVFVVLLSTISLIVQLKKNRRLKNV